jgi:hypothetical protein
LSTALNVIEVMVLRIHDDGAARLEWVGVLAQPARPNIAPVADAPVIRVRRLSIKLSLSPLGSQIKKRGTQCPLVSTRSSDFQVVVNGGSWDWTTVSLIRHRPTQSTVGRFCSSISPEFFQMTS